MTYDELALGSRAAFPTSSRYLYESSLALMTDLPQLVQRLKFAPRGPWCRQEEEAPSISSVGAGYYFIGASRFAWSTVFPHWQGLGYGTRQYGRRRFPSRFVFHSEGKVRFLEETANLLLEVTPLVPGDPQSGSASVGGAIVSYTRSESGWWRREGHWTVAEHQKVGEGLKRVDEALLTAEAARNRARNRSARMRELARRMGIKPDSRIRRVR